jgi:hypothetical protein
MSVLSIPRIFFKGYSQWDPCTINNNDQWPTYAFTNAELNWDFLGKQVPQITKQNFQTAFPPWAQTLQVYKNPGPPPTQWNQPPAEWNYYGGNNFSLQGINNQQTMITGGQLAYNSNPVTNDSLVNSAVNLLGDAYPWDTSNTPTSPRLVDINPAAFWSTDFYLRYFQIGNNTGPYVYGAVAPGTRMCSRWMNVQRNLGAMEIAGVAGIVTQTCLPTQTLTINSGGSNLLSQLSQGLQQPGVQGVMVRFVVYMTQYFTRDEFASCTGLSGSDLMTCQYTKLTQLWAEALQNNQTPIQNPAASLVLGTVGLWMENELVSVPGGRYLVPSALVQPNNIPVPPGQSPVTAGLGPAVAELHSENNQEYLSLDLSSTIPEIDSSGTKANIGPLTVNLQLPDGQNLTIGTISYSGNGLTSYNQAAYEATAGIIDLQLPANVTSQQVQEGMLSVQLTTPGMPVTALSETALSPDAITVQTDQRGIRVDEGNAGSLTIQISQRGAAPTGTVNVLMAQYGPDPPPPQANASAWALLGSKDAIIEFQNGSSDVIVVPASANGVAQINFKPLRPGFPMIVFFPFLDGEPKPVPPPQIIPVFQPGAPLTIASAFYSCVRVMPFDNSLPQQFADLWNKTHSLDDAWQYVYNNILYVYDMLYPVMKYYAGIDLGSQSSVNQSITYILQLISSNMLDQTVYMPVTRELSSGKRAVLQMYGSLVESNGSVETLEPPQGFSEATT